MNAQKVLQIVLALGVLGVVSVGQGQGLEGRAYEDVWWAEKPTLSAHQW